MSMIQCPACRGVKQMRKLGNMMGPCDTCAASGVVESDSLPKREATAPLLPTFGNPKETAQHYVKQEEQTRRDALKYANVAYLNKPVQVESKKENVTATQVAQAKAPIHIDPTIKQAPSLSDPKAPKPLSPDSLEAIKMRSETVERDDTIMAAQRADLGVETKDVVQPAKGKASGKKSKSA